MRSLVMTNLLQVYFGVSL